MSIIGTVPLNWSNAMNFNRNAVAAAPPAPSVGGRRLIEEEVAARGDESKVEPTFADGSGERLFEGRPQRRATFALEGEQYAQNGYERLDPAA